MKTLYVSDLDGTLLGENSQLTGTSVSLLNEAIGKGAMVTVATARTPSTVSTIMKDVNTRLPFIVMTGCAIWDPSLRKYDNIITMKPEVVADIMATIRRHQLPIFIYTINGQVIDIYHYGPLSEIEKEFISQRDSTPFKRFHLADSPEPLLPPGTDNVILFYAMQPTARTKAAFEDIRNIRGCNPLYYHDIFGDETGILEIFPEEATKANAMLMLKKMTGADRVVAFGDNINDIPLLKAADMGIAVGNAVDELKKEADLIIDCNTDDAVARYIIDNI